MSNTCFTIDNCSWLAVSGAFFTLRHDIPAMCWMNFRLQAITAFNPNRTLTELFSPDKTQVMLEFAMLGDMLTPTENEEACQEQ